MTTVKKKAPVRTPPRIEWPTALALTAVLAALVAVWAFSSPEQRSTMLTGIAALGSVVLAIMRQMLAAQDHDAEPPDSAAPAVRAPNGLDRHEPLNRDDERGRMRVGLPAFARPLAPLLLALALIASGCGASALTAHARVYAFAAITLEATHETMVSTCTALRDACAGGASCIESARASCLDVATAQDATRDAVDLYQRILTATNLAGEDADIMRSVVAALGIAAEAWAALGRTLGHIGRDLPALPSWALDILSTVGGAS